MKVLHLIGGGDVGGAKSHVLSLVNELGKYIDVKLISFRKGPFADDARAMGINVEIVKTGTILTDIRKILHIIKNEDYDVIHSHGAKANMIAVSVKKFTKIPVVTTVHSDYRLDYLQNILKMFSFGLINTVALRFIEYHIGVSNNFKQMLIKRRFSPQNIFTVYNGIDFKKEVSNLSKEHFLNKYNLNFAKDDVLIGILARLHPVKGISTLLQAAKLVVDKNPSVKFLIGGDGEERKSLEKKASSLGLNNNVFFLGFVNDPLDLINCIDINVLTSLSESFPYAILEGALFKKATVSTNVGGISDLIESGKNGFLFEPKDHKTFSKHLLNLVNNSSLREKMGDSLFEKANTYFSLHNMCKTQLSIYNTILEREDEKRKSGYTYDTIISGYYGFKNIGDDAMLKAIIDNLQSYKKDVRIMVLSKNPLETRQIYNIDSINRFNIPKIISIMRKSKLFLNGGGNLLQDNTSTRSLLYYLGMIWLAKKIGMKVMIYANGIGPLNKKNNRKLTRKVVNQVDAITLREELSHREIQNLGIKKPKISLTADPAVTIKAESDEEVSQILLKENINPSENLIGFSVRKWSDYEKYQTVIAKVADYIYDTYGVKSLFIPMHYPGDLLIIDNITAKMKNKCYVIRNKYSVPQMLGIIGRTQLLIGMRLHALIFAASLKIPLVGLVYETKVEGFMQYIDQPSAGHVSSLEFEKIIETVDCVWNKRDSIKKDLEKTTEVLRDKALKNAKIALELIDEN
ncbi:polysaccharide pyruvyl transferase CsaB [Herbivorax sp. ANBcel31]|uniref:polysaccharide pyruvyl transferase CsaB n=1 Tax=Herbivorax sp. ANBcel31 TaxID=3069754 RepID=UPI0027B1F2D9|nr:polysaccharide pyruvyl transferase CsaB [Herbivorax sp. ANBcel31]MDQ2085608.1 polysaccharide pyruvyl transferase CsaB [Herbivorax sp. ANBcel31]